MAKSEAKAVNQEKPALVSRSGTMAMKLTEEEFKALPDALKEQISRSPSPKDSIGYYFDKLVASLKEKADPTERRFNVKDVLVWAFRQNGERIFKIQSIRTVLKKRLEEGEIVEVAGTPGRDKVYEVVA